MPGRPAARRPTQWQHCTAATEAAADSDSRTRVEQPTAAGDRRRHRFPGPPAPRWGSGSPAAGPAAGARARACTGLAAAWRPPQRLRFQSLWTHTEFPFTCGHIEDRLEPPPAGRSLTVTAGRPRPGYEKMARNEMIRKSLK